MLFEDLDTLEEMHHSNFFNFSYIDFSVLDVYLWLGQKYPEAFKEMERAKTLKDAICKLIDKALDEAKPMKI